MTNLTENDLATMALRRWNELREQGVDCRDRMDDPELQQLERELDAVRREMAPIKQAIARR